MKRGGMIAAALASVALVASSGLAAEPPASLKFKMKSIDGKPVDLAKYNGRVMLVVNLASQ
ncbi:MAG: hypothetical protein VB859_04140 [Planctomycetaceae bacterium]